MTEHSSIEEVEFACMIASDAPVFTEADYEAIHQMLDEAHCRVRSVFIGGQTPGVPDDWRIDGLLYRAVDIQINRAKEKLTQKYRASKFFSGQRRKDKMLAKAKDAVDEHSWQTLKTADDYWKYKQQGFDVRRIEAGRKTTYQFATRKEVAKGRTQI